jgi:hypothetical protein
MLAMPLLFGCSNAPYNFGALGIGAFREDVGTVQDAGAVNVIRGSANGLSSAGNQIWSQSSVNIEGEPVHNENFSESLASGDFNNDGFADLAIGVPGEFIEPTGGRPGAVNVLYGTIGGLSSADSQIWSQSTGGIKGDPEDGDGFGGSLAAGDFNNDGFVDLAVGVPGEDIVTIASAGTVNVLYGSANGLSSVGDQIWNQSTGNIEGVAEAFDNFGSSLASGDFNNDGFADLAIGVPLESVGSAAYAGAVNILYGSAHGLSSVGNQIWHQSSSNIAGVSEEDDRFGASLATGDFNADGFADLAVGVPREDIGTVEDAGAVTVIYGSATGLRSTGNQVWSQSSSNIEGAAEAFDNFGSSLATGDFDNDGFSDLAVGVPRESVGTTLSAGSVNVLYGSATGLRSARNQIWNQSSNNIVGNLDAGDSFGTSLAAGDFNNDGFADLAAGAPWEDIEGAPGGGFVNNAGAVNVLYGSVTGLRSAGNQIWSQSSANIEGVTEDGDFFGISLVYIEGYTAP